MLRSKTYQLIPPKGKSTRGPSRFCGAAQKSKSQQLSFRVDLLTFLFWFECPSMNVASHFNDGTSPPKAFSPYVCVPLRLADSRSPLVDCTAERQASPGQSKTVLGAAKIAAEAFRCSDASLRVHIPLPSPKAHPRRYRHVFWLQEDNTLGGGAERVPLARCAREQKVAAELAAPKPARHYHFVHYHSKNKNWYVARRGVHEFGFETEEAAAKAAPRKRSNSSGAGSDES